MVEVSIICNCYNHEKYIREALEGFIKQKTNFEFEVLIHDDASTDRSAEIIREYEKKYPEVIKPIYQIENQYSKKSGLVYKIQRERVGGKYIAFCEGDDYWTDENKLQIQYDLLESNPNVDICAHKAEAIDAKKGNVVRVIAPRDANSLIPVEEVIEGDGGFVATNTLFFRSSIYNKPMKFREKWPYDYALQIQGSLAGGMLYVNRNMSVYRMNCEGSWTQRTHADKNKYVQHNSEMILMLKTADHETKHCFHKSFLDRIQFYEFLNLPYSKNYARMIQNKYFKQEKLINKIKIFIKVLIRYKN